MNKLYYLSAISLGIILGAIGLNSMNTNPQNIICRLNEITNSIHCNILKFKRKQILRPHTDPDKKDNSQFGKSLAISGNLLFVGAPGGDANNENGLGDGNGNNISDQGFVEVFEITPNGIVKYSQRWRCF